MNEQVLPNHTKFFVPISATVRRMVSASRMRVELFMEDADSWYLILRHPLGSMSKLLFTRQVDGRVAIGGSWWQDKPSENLRLNDVFEECVVRYDVGEIEACTTTLLARIHSNATDLGR